MALTVTGSNIGSVTVGGRTLTVLDHASESSISVVENPTSVSVAETGIQGPPGPPGPVSTNSFTFNQSVANSVWTINHTLPYRPNITLVNSIGQIIFANVDYVSATQITVSHSVPIAGTAYLS